MSTGGEQLIKVAFNSLVEKRRKQKEIKFLDSCFSCFLWLLLLLLLLLLLSLLFPLPHPFGVFATQAKVASVFPCFHGKEAFHGFQLQKHH